MPANKPRSLHVYLHVATMGTFWREVVAELAGEIAGSGLYDAAATLTAGIVGEESILHLPIEGSRWKSHKKGAIGRFEYPTLEMLWRHAAEDPESYVLYLHSKGVRDEHYRGFRARWRRIMSHQLVARWRECVRLLDDGIDAVGSLYARDPFPHYSGNFWWARADYVRTLPKPEPIEGGINRRVWAEMWLMSREPRPVVYDWGTVADMIGAVTRGEYRRFGAGHVVASGASSDYNYPAQIVRR